MTEDAKLTKQAELRLGSILTEAFHFKAVCVEFEHQSDGLEVTHYIGETGLGKLYHEPGLGSAIMGLVESRASRGKLQFPVQGVSRSMRVKWFGSFGETCLRLILDPNAVNSPVVADERDPDDFDDMPAMSADCQGCDMFAEVDSLGLCDVCGAKLERDMIRQRDWEYTFAGFGLPESERESYRQKIVDEYGEGLELIAEEPRPKPTTAGKSNRNPPSKSKSKAKAKSKAKRKSRGR